jgi:hypothetical protein
VALAGYAMSTKGKKMTENYSGCESVKRKYRREFFHFAFYFSFAQVTLKYLPFPFEMPFHTFSLCFFSVLRSKNIEAALSEVDHYFDISSS